MTDFGDRIAAARNVSHQYDRTTALVDVSARFPAGTVTAVVGGDGAGKSTLLRCLVGQVVPAAGEVSRPPKQQIGYMPATSGTWRALSVVENLEFVLRAYGRSLAQERRRVNALLERAGLARVQDRLAGDLSGGMRHKLGFVLAVVHEPTLLVLDEPSTGVDPISRVELWGLVVDAAARGAAVAMATTYLDEAERANTLLVLDEGHVLAAGSRDVVLARTPGSVATVERPDEPTTAWRRGNSIRQWSPETESGDASPPADLEDAIIAYMLDRSARAEMR